jgi:hypothetical protein
MPLPLARTISDHTPCMVQISTTSPKAIVFRFESYWIDRSGFLETVQGASQSEVISSNSSTRVAAKFKLLRRVLKIWALGLSNLKKQIKQCNEVLLVLDKLEENRPLHT